MEIQTQEARIILVIDAIRLSKRLSIRSAARVYRIPRITFIDRMAGRTSFFEVRTNCTKMIEVEKSVLIQYILELDARGFVPRIAGVEDIANKILESQGKKYIGIQWAYRFVQRYPDLKTRFNRVYNFQRVLCEDLEFIGAWFRLVSNIQTKYGILDYDFYNFDETGFIIGVISPAMVVIHADRRGRGKAVQPGNREWATVIVCVNNEG